MAKAKKRKGCQFRLRKFFLHSIRQKLIDFANVFTFIILFLVSILVIFICFQKDVFSGDFGDNIFHYFSLLPYSLFTSTSVIAILGPTILSLNYRLFKGYTSHQSKNHQNNNYAQIHEPSLSRFIDAQFDHSHQLSALILAWGAFSYQFLITPIVSLINLANNLSIKACQSGYGCNDTCLINYSYGDAIDQLVNIIKYEPLSLAIITLAIGFIIWIFVRLISGQLSTTEIVVLYERETNETFSSPPIASRITLYRYILVMFSFLYYVWSKNYLLALSRDELIRKCDFGPMQSKSIINSLNESLNLTLTSNDEIYFILFIILFLLTILVSSHFIANFKYILKSKISLARANKIR